MLHLARNEFDQLGAELELCRDCIRPDLDPEALMGKRRTLHAAYSRILLDAQIDTVDRLTLMF